MSQARLLTNLASKVVYNAEPEETHVNISRYVNGICPKYRKKQMNMQLRNLLNVNDAPTIPNPSGSGAVSSKVIFGRLVAKIS
jgi:hypothetical protein